jgi:hypothetical protein
MTARRAQLRGGQRTDRRLALCAEWAFGLVRLPAHRERESRGVLRRWEFYPSLERVLGEHAGDDGWDAR